MSERNRMSCRGSSWSVGRQAVDEVRRIAKDGVVTIVRAKVLNGRLHNADSVVPRRSLHVVSGLGALGILDINAIDEGVLRTLRGNEGDDPRACTDIKDTTRIRHLGPCAQQHRVCAHFHVALVINHRETLKLKMRS